MLDGGQLRAVSELFKLFLEIYVMVHVRLNHALEVFWCGIEHFVRNECETPLLLWSQLLGAFLQAKLPLKHLLIEIHKEILWYLMKVDGAEVHQRVSEHRVQHILHASLKFLINPFLGYGLQEFPILR